MPRSRRPARWRALPTAGSRSRPMPRASIRYAWRWHTRSGWISSTSRCAIIRPPAAAGGGGTRNAAAIYQFPRQTVVHHLIPDPQVRTSALRSLGAFANVFAIECFLDELAEFAGEDAVAYRLALLSDPRARRVIETVATMCDWSARLRGAEPGGGRGIGLGMARYKNRGGYAAVVAEVEVDEEVRLAKMWCAADGGLDRKSTR